MNYRCADNLIHPKCLARRTRRRRRRRRRWTSASPAGGTEPGADGTVDLALSASGYFFDHPRQHAAGDVGVTDGGAAHLRCPGQGTGASEAPALRTDLSTRVFSARLDAGTVAAAVGAAAGRAALLPPPSPPDALPRRAGLLPVPTARRSTRARLGHRQHAGALPVPLWLADVAVWPARRRQAPRLHCLRRPCAAAPGPARPLLHGGPGTEFVTNAGQRRTMRLRHRSALPAALCRLAPVNARRRESRAQPAATADAAAAAAAATAMRAPTTAASLAV